MNATHVLDEHFLKTRSQLLDVAAFLDRLDRAEGNGDFRSDALRYCLFLLADTKPDKTRRILELLSDPTTEPIDHAPGKGAAGAYPEFRKRD